MRSVARPAGEEQVELRRSYVWQSQLRVWQDQPRRTWEELRTEEEPFWRVEYFQMRRSCSGEVECVQLRRSCRRNWISEDLEL